MLGEIIEISALDQEKRLLEGKMDEVEDKMYNLYQSLLQHGLAKKVQRYDEAELCENLIVISEDKEFIERVQFAKLVPIGDHIYKTVYYSKEKDELVDSEDIRSVETEFN